MKPLKEWPQPKERTVIEVRPGDVFATENPMALGRIINWVQRNTNRDGKSKYTHVGIIINRFGRTFEALWTYKEQNIQDYSDKDIVIFRHKGMTTDTFQEGWDTIKHLKGKWYPGYRLPLFLFGLAKYSFIKKPVCSELFRMFINGCGLVIRKIFGTDPDDVVDVCRSDKDYQLIYEGKCSDMIIRMG